jgi:hypothetical protein
MTNSIRTLLGGQEFGRYLPRDAALWIAQAGRAGAVCSGVRVKYALLSEKKSREPISTVATGQTE